MLTTAWLARAARGTGDMSSGEAAAKEPTVLRRAAVKVFMAYMLMDVERTGSLSDICVKERLEDGQYGDVDARYIKICQPNWAAERGVYILARHSLETVSLYTGLRNRMPEDCLVVRRANFLFYASRSFYTDILDAQLVCSQLSYSHLCILI